VDDLIRFLRPCGTDFPDGKQFGEWGPLWNYHSAKDGKWIRGQVDHLGQMAGQHGGKDICCPSGTPLRSPCAGKIIRAGWQDPEERKRGWGLSYMIVPDEHPGLILTMGHFSSLGYANGVHVHRGEILGLSGDTGNTGTPPFPHVHAQLEKAGDYPRMPLAFKWVQV
jgi:murein DD-endopeptidase MepM/ murein hydrolase activator NlpD